MMELERDLATLDRNDLEEGVDHEEVLDRYWERRLYTESEQDLAYLAMTRASGEGNVCTLALEILRCPLRDGARWTIAAREALRREDLGPNMVLLELAHLPAEYTAQLLPQIESTVSTMNFVDRWCLRKRVREARDRLSFAE